MGSSATAPPVPSTESGLADVTIVAKRDYDPIPLSSLAFWASPAEERDASFRDLRQERPVSWHPPFEGAMMPALDPDGGSWAVVRHADVVAVSRTPELFCSGQGVMLEDVPTAVLDAAQS